jgi:hypothetical protein
MFKKIIISLLAGFLFISSAGAQECRPAFETIVAVASAVGLDEVQTMDKITAQAFVKAYNEEEPKTNYISDTVYYIIHPQMPTYSWVALADGNGCFIDGGPIPTSELQRLMDGKEARN